MEKIQNHENFDQQPRNLDTELTRINSTEQNTTSTTTQEPHDKNKIHSREENAESSTDKTETIASQIPITTESEKSIVHQLTMSLTAAFVMLKKPV